jgi:flavodoxin
MKPLVIHNHESGNNRIAAEFLANQLKCEAVSVAKVPCIESYEPIVFVVPNIGDEELPQPMEDYLFHMKTRGKKYYICELGNYFGFENYNGCKKVAIKLLAKLDWIKISDVSIDSMPKLDISSLESWSRNIK